MIINDIQAIIDSYLDENDYYNRTRESKNGNIDIKNELTEYFTTLNIKFKIEEEEDFDSPGYAEDFMAIAFLDENDELQLLTVLFEYY
ncbi:hypothetical protein [Agathobacter rectalis]|uniref:Uncharacterized protein n=1 Tax=Agathobacter rectalis TaxID=39491 RepID=A0A3E4YLL8_9FIRM|nr:hypothetical protein [Agathobacter rectalis]RGM75600.1 hypothetical protein DXB99_03470 [Agathobacter rectalis]